MKKLLLSVSALTLFTTANAQCTPVNCQADLTFPDLGGVCDTVLIDAVVNTAGYSDFESFVLTGACFDAGLIDESQSGTNIKIKTIKNFTFTGLPNGITGQTNQANYTSPGTMNSDNSQTLAGCVSFSGTPTEIGVFNATMNFLVDVLLCDLFFIEQSDNAASYVLWMTVKPVPTFSGLASNYCVTDGAVTLTPTGTAGGTFSGPGVTGNSFNPATAGVGTHEIMYLVSAQQGAAIAPAADSLIMTVEVFAAGTTFYQDADNDGYGDLNSTATGCTIPSGYVSNSDDCDDAAPNINPGETDTPGNGIDEDCSGSDASLGLVEINNELLNVYPNPTTGVLTIDLSGFSTINSIEIIDLNGRIIETKTVNAESVTTDLSALKNGFFFVKVNTVKGSVLRRIALQH